MREQAQWQVCKHAMRSTNKINRHYRLASTSTKQMVSDKCHKRERQVNQSHASESDNFNGAEKVFYIYIDIWPRRTSDSVRHYTL